MIKKLNYSSCGGKDGEKETPLSNLTETNHLDEHHHRQQSEKEESTPTTTADENVSEIDQTADQEEPAVVKMSVETYYSPSPAVEVISGRERLKRHRNEVAGRVWIPELWGQEKLLKEWTDCSAFDNTLFPSGLMSARAALVREGRRANMENRCS